MATLRDGWTAVAVLAMGACTPAPPTGTPRATEAGIATPAPATGDEQPLRGTIIVGKDGYGFTACGSMQQQRVEFSTAAQAVVDGHLDGGGAMEFGIEGHGATHDGRLVLERVAISPAAVACATSPDAPGA